MKFYETTDVNFFVDKLSTWEHCCKYAPNKTWEHKPKDDVRFLNFYRDYEAAYREENFTRHCYYLKEYNWHNNRIVPWACLPFFYAGGYRFIKLQRTAPLDFKCAEFPMNLREVREKVADMEAKAKEKLKKELFEKAIKEKCEKNSRKPKKK